MPTTKAQPTPFIDPDAYEGEEREAVVALNKLLHKPAKSILKVSDDLIERSYDAGYSYYEAGDYPKAEVIFKLLSTLDHQELKYWKALGAARQMLGKFEEAVEAYCICWNESNKDGDLFLHLGECHLNLGDHENAHYCLDQLLNLTRNDPEQKALFQRGEVLMKALKGKEKKQSNEK